jgi:hypothetical protein
MRIFSLATILLVLFCFGTQTQAQQNMTPGPVWHVTMYKVKPGKANDVQMDMRRNFRVVNEEPQTTGPDLGLSGVYQQHHRWPW